MPFLQILTGERADELFELHPSASLVVGSAPDAHIRLPDPKVAESHCQVFPARGGYWLRDLGQGPTVSNLRRVTGETARLTVRDILIIGHTFVRYLEERPAPPPAAGPQGADPQELTKAHERVRALEAQVRTLQAQAQAQAQAQTQAAAKGADPEELARAQERVRALEAQVRNLEGHVEGTQTERATSRQILNDLRAQLVSAEDTSQRSVAELERARERVQTLEKELDKARGRLNEVKEEARQALAAKTEEIELSQEALAELEATLTREQGQLKQSQEALKKAGQQVTALQEELAQVKRETEARVSSAGSEQRQRLGALETSLAATLASLDAARAALQGLGVEPPAAPDRPEGVAPLELTAVLDEASVSAEVRARLEQALVAHIDRESLRRFSGPPFAWERPQRAVDVIAELASLRARGERRQTGLHLGTSTA